MMFLFYNDYHYDFIPNQLDVKTTNHFFKKNIELKNMVLTCTNQMNFQRKKIEATKFL
jgi:hypothetical protein